MKKRIAAAALLYIFSVGLVFGVLPFAGSADTSGYCFLAVNDRLRDLSVSPAFIGGITYVPASELSAYSVYTTTFSDNSTISVYSGSAQLYFDMSAGGSYDGAGNEYTVSAVYRGGSVYVPAVFVCNFFGISCTYIKGVGYGDIVRLNNGSAVLSDSGFLDAAKSSMQAYTGISTATPSPKPSLSPSPSPSPSPRPSPSPSPSPNRSGTSVYISFSGMPDEALIDELDKYGIRTCFFLSPEEVLDAPDMLLLLVSRGQRVGVLCGSDPEADYAEASALIYEICRMQTLFVASYQNPGECQEMADSNGLIYWHYDIGGADSATGVTSLIASRVARADLRLETGGAAERVLPWVLSYLSTNKYSVRVFSEAENPYRYVETE